MSDSAATDPPRGTDFEFIAKLPPWAGVNFVEKHNHDIPDSLAPRKQTLPLPFVAMVTGASRGIGRGIAKAFAEAGATGLILTARNADSLQRTTEECRQVAKSPDLKITLLSANNAVEESAIQVAEAIRKEHNGMINLLVNNAGILNVDETVFGDDIVNMNSANIEVPMQTNFLGRFYMIKHLLPLLLATPGTSKSIINISSVGSHVNGPLGFSISALATNRLSQRVADAYGDKGILCCAVHPGAVTPEIMPPGAPDRFREFSTDDPGLCGAFLIWLVKEQRTWLNGRYVDSTWDVEELVTRREEIVEKDMLKMRLVC